MTTLIKIEGKDGVRGRCDARCYNGKPGRCSCCCGGINHGAGIARAKANIRDLLVENIVLDLRDRRLGPIVVTLTEAARQYELFGWTK